MEKKRKPFRDFLEEHFEDLVLCPVSRTVMFDSIVANDGFIYEASIFDQCLKCTHYSPITRERLDKTTYPLPSINKFIEYGEKYDLEVCKNKYVIDDSFESNYELICSALLTGKFDKIMKFKHFKLDMVYSEDQYFCHLICRAKHNDINTKQYHDCLKYILDNSEDLMVKLGSQNILHVFARTCMFPKLVGYICQILQEKHKINPNVLMIKDFNDTTPLDYLSMRGDQECIEAILESGLDFPSHLPGMVNLSIQQATNIKSTIVLIALLDNKNIFTNDMSPLFTAIRYRKVEIIDHLLAMGADLYAVNKNNINAIHYACQYGTRDTLMKLLDHCDNKEKILEQETFDGWLPIHIACYYNSVQVIEYLMGKDVRTYIPIKKFKGEARQYLPINLIELNQNINEKQLGEMISNMIQMMEVQQL